MPVLARLSRNFYDKFGEDCADEIMNLINSWEPPPRTELQAPNERALARLDATPVQHPADEHVRWRQRATMDREKRVLEDLRWEARQAEQEMIWELRMSEQDARWALRTAESETRLTRWMVAFWIASIAMQVGAYYVMLTPK